MSKGFASTYRIVLLAGGLFVCFAGLGVRLVFLHVVDREEWLGTIEKARTQTTVEKARRGDILDRNGAYLATSRPMIIVGVDPSALVETEKEKEKWPKLAALLGLPATRLTTIFNTKLRAPAPGNPVMMASPAAERASLVFKFDLSKPAAAGMPAAGEGDEDTQVDPEADSEGRRRIKWVKLAENIPEDTMTAIEKLGIHGVYRQRPAPYRRIYPNNQLAAHLVGYVARDERPIAGVEYYADFYLRGQNGWSIGERDGRGRELAQFRSREVPRANGYSVKLSIDATVQAIVEQELDYLAKKFQPQKATIIVSDPRTGFILGMGNYPTFNLNEYNKVPKDEMAAMKNVAVTDVYDPGSVFKIVAASAALEEGLVTPERKFDCTLAKIFYKGRTLDLPGESHPFTHDLTVAEIVAHSSNKGAAQLAIMLGDVRFDRYARAFGFGRRLGFPIGGEVPGLFWPVEKWNPIDITRIAMGQSVSVTVLQMHQAMSVIANDGVLLRPQIISEIHDASGELVYNYKPVALNPVISEKTAQTMAHLLMAVASKEGTAPEAAIPGYDVAGKTGTTQKYMPEIMSNGTTKLMPSSSHHVLSFVGFFPAKARPGEPQVAISVVVDDADAHAPGGVASGAKIAAPSFKTIGEKLIPILKIKPANPPARPPLLAATEGGRR